MKRVIHDVKEKLSRDTHHEKEPNRNIRDEELSMSNTKYRQKPNQQTISKNRNNI